MLKDLSTTTAHKFLRNGNGPKQAFYKWALSSDFSVLNARAAWKEIQLKAFTGIEKSQEADRALCRKIGSIWDKMGGRNSARKGYEKAAICHSKAVEFFYKAKEGAMAEKSLLKKIEALKNGIEQMEGPSLCGNRGIEHSRKMERLRGALLGAMRGIADHYRRESKGQEESNAREIIADLKKNSNNGGISAYRLLWAAYHVLQGAGIKVKKPTIS
jgi:hypothetical protein